MEFIYFLIATGLAGLLMYIGVMLVTIPFSTFPSKPVRHHPDRDGDALVV